MSWRLTGGWSVTCFECNTECGSELHHCALFLRLILRFELIKMRFAVMGATSCA